MGNGIQIWETYDICKYTPEYLTKVGLIFRKYLTTVHVKVIYFKLISFRKKKTWIVTAKHTTNDETL